VDRDNRRRPAVGLFQRVVSINGELAIECSLAREPSPDNGLTQPPP
jgi:hypothetical protein